MLAKYPLSSATIAPSCAAHATSPVTLPGSEVAELIRLARAVLLKSPDDLAAIASAAPAMTGEWLIAFQAERARAEAEAKFWTGAITYLMATTPGNIANDG
jgi:hypothetical protein